MKARSVVSAASAPPQLGARLAVTITSAEIQQIHARNGARLAVTSAEICRLADREVLDHIGIDVATITSFGVAACFLMPSLQTGANWLAAGLNACLSIQLPAEINGMLSFRHEGQEGRLCSHQVNWRLPDMRSTRTGAMQPLRGGRTGRAAIHAASSATDARRYNAARITSANWCGDAARYGETRAEGGAVGQLN